MQKVQPGHPLQIKAADWNSLVDASNYVRNLQANQHSRTIKNRDTNGIVYVKNMETGTFPLFSAITLVDVLLKPGISELEFINQTPVFGGRQTTDTVKEKPYAILLDPLPPGQVGRGMLQGITPTRILLQAPEHQYAEPAPGNNYCLLQSSETGTCRILWKYANSGLQWCLVQLGGAGSGGGGNSAVLCQITSQINDQSYSVALYAHGKSGGITGYGTLFATEVALGSTLPIGSWVIGHKNLVIYTGGLE